MERQLADTFQSLNPIDTRIHRFGEDFYDVICRSGRFSWMGVFQTVDQLKMPHIVIYLEDVPSSESGVDRRQSSDIVSPFRDLFFAFHPRLFLDLYYSNPVEEPNRVERCLEDARMRYQSTEVEKLWDGVLPTVI